MAGRLQYRLHGVSVEASLVNVLPRHLDGSALPILLVIGRDDVSEADHPRGQPDLLASRTAERLAVPTSAASHWVRRATTAFRRTAIGSSSQVLSLSSGGPPVPRCARRS